MYTGKYGTVNIGDDLQRMPSENETYKVTDIADITLPRTFR